MTTKTKAKSQGFIDKRKMQKYDVLCLEPVQDYDAAKVKALRERLQRLLADLGLPDAGKLKVKSGLVIEITRAVRRLGLTQEEAGRRMGI